MEYFPPCRYRVKPDQGRIHRYSYKYACPYRRLRAVREMIYNSLLDISACPQSFRLIKIGNYTWYSKNMFFFYNLLYTSLINLISTNILSIYICWCLNLAIKIRSISLIWNTWVTKIVHETLYHILLSKDIIFVLTNNQTIFLYDISSRFSDTLTHLTWWQFCSIGVSLYKTFESHIYI